MPLLPRRLHLAVLVDVVVAVSVGVLPLWWWHQALVLSLTYGVLIGVTLMWRRHRPIAVLVLVAGLTAAAAPIRIDGAGLREGALLVALAVATHAVVAHAASLRTAVVGTVVAVLGASPVLRVATSEVDPRTAVDLADTVADVVGLLPYAAVVWGAGLTVRLFRQQGLAAAEHLVRAEREHAHLTRIAVAEERTRIARELHDVVAHTLSVIILQANGGEYAFDHEPDRSREALRTIGATGAGALDEIRQLVRLLRSDDDTDTGPDHAVSSVVERARAAGAMVDLIVDGAPARLPAGVELAVYRIVQESLTNVLKHAGPAPSATVCLAYRPGSVHLEVTDDGGGIAPSPSEGHGLIGMRERATLYGGTFDAGPTVSGGWRVRAHLPLSVEAVPA
jgi:signal transduction histidine kinase